MCPTCVPSGQTGRGGGTPTCSVWRGALLAKATKNYLGARGVGGSRMTTSSYGKERPVARGAAEASPNEARERMLARRWQPGMVSSLLSAAGADASRPEELAPGLGLLDDGYQLSEVQAREILEMRLHRLTGLEQEKQIGRAHV